MEEIMPRIFVTSGSEKTVSEIKGPIPEKRRDGKNELEELKRILSMQPGKIPAVNFPAGAAAQRGEHPG